MKQTAYFYSKPVDISRMGYFPYADPEQQCEYIIKAKYEMSEEQFSSFTMNLLEDQPFIQDFNKENIMHRDLNDIENVIEVYCKESDYSLLVNSEGYSYARYVAVIPNEHKKRTGLTKEQIEFLKTLQEELKNQDTVGQADPRFWAVAQYEWHNCWEENAQDHHYCNGETTYESFEALKERLKESDYLDSNGHFNKEDLEEWEDQEDFHLDSINDYDDLPKYVREEYYQVPVQKVHVIKKDTMFLTIRECKEHIKRNHYHYNDTVHTYAMTAWRSPQVEKLIKLLQEADFEEVNHEKS